MTDVTDGKQEWRLTPATTDDRLLELPFAMRWEVTRRHPIYQLFWEGARRHHRGEGAVDPFLAEVLYTQALQLGRIGVSGEPVDPATSAEEVLAGSSLVWHGSAVRPLSVRAMLASLLALLPAEERIDLAQILTESADPAYALADDPGGERQKAIAIDRFVRLPNPMFDAIPTAPYFYVNLDASQRAMESDLADLVKRYRSEPREDRRLRLPSIADQLAVWDLREGWNAGRYEFAKERKLADIASELDLPVSTVIDRFKAAYCLIHGRDYCREAWWRHFGKIKYGMAELEGQQVPRVSRPARTPDKTSGASDDALRDAPTLQFDAGMASGAEFAETLDDLRTLFAAGKSNAEIVAALGFKDMRAEELVAALRERVGELDQLG